MFSAVVLALTSCNLAGNNGGSPAQAGKDYFKEYTFVGTVTQEKKATILEAVQKNALRLSSIISHQESYQKAGYSTESASSDATMRICEDNSKQNFYVSKTSTHSKRSQSNDGVTITTETYSDSSNWDGGNGYQYYLTNSTTDGESEETATAYAISEELTNKEFKENRLTSALNIPTPDTIYKNSDGSYTIIDSDINKEIYAYEWGSGTKEYNRTRKYQRVYSISSDYYLTGYYIYEESKANRDPSTGEWFSSETLLARSYQYIQYRYEFKDNASITILNNSIANKTFFVSVNNVDVYESIVTCDMTDASYTFSNNYSNIYTRQLTLLSSDKTTGIYRYRFITSLSYRGRSYYDYDSGRDYREYYAQRFVLTAKTLRGVNISERTYNFTLNSSYTNSNYYRYFTVITDGGNVYVINIENYDSNPTVAVEFTFNSNTAVIDNVSYY